MIQATRACIAAPLVLLAGLCTYAQPAVAEAPGLTEPARPVRIAVTRRSLAREYLVLERAAVAARGKIDDERIAEANRVFDRATRFFFRGDYPEAIRAIHRARAMLEGRDAEAMQGEQIEFLPDRLYVGVGEAAEVTVGVRRLYGDAAALAVEGVITLPCARGEVAVPFSIAADGSPSTARLAIPAAEPGACVPEAMVGATNQRIALPVIRITGVPLSARRASLLARLGALAPTPAIGRALATCRARVELLSEVPVDSSSATYTLDLARVADEAESEVGALEAGRDPYAHRSGDLWCVFDLGGVPTPMRLIVPDNLPDGPRALVVAVHGAGGDENLFAEGYGAGIIRSLAAKHGVIVACPAAGLMAPNPGYLDAILDTVRGWHEIDPARVHLIGHSLGGGIVSSWAKAKPDQIAAVVSIAGIGSFAGAGRLPRVLAVAGELDPLVTADRTREQARIARAQGLNVEYRQVDHYGHTLVVGKVLPEAFEWLLGKPGDQ